MHCDAYIEGADLVSSELVLAEIPRAAQRTAARDRRAARPSAEARAGK